jgi:subtilisin family serine protease
VKRNLVVTILFVSAAFAFFTFAAYQSEGQEQEAKSQRVENEEQEAKYRRAKEPIPNRYIVVLEDWSTGGRGEASRAADVADEMRSIYGGKVERVFKHAISGFTAELDAREVEALMKDPRVKYVEEDGIVSIGTTQTNATWGLDRIDQRDLPLNGTYTYTPTGSGVRAYIIDTGILASHNEFGGRVTSGFTSISDGNGTSDCNGHGTHVAGTTGGAVYGVAKSVTLVPVRVLNCQGSGTNSGVIAGVDWVTANHVKPAVANMSLGGSASSALDTAVNNSINAGVTYVVAAGNSNADACNYSPARVTNAVTVGSTTSSDARSSFSNFGSCLDIFAPGSSITAAWYTSNTATNTISGTSMASPHVAGVAALYLQDFPLASPSTVASAIINAATTGKVTSAGSGSPNRLLYSLLSGGSPTPTPTPTPGGTELLVNGGFEGSLSPWVNSGTGAFYTSNGNYPQAGTGYIYLGVNNSVSGSSYQQVSIPSTANGTLTFWLNVTSSETTTTTQYDRLFVEVRNTSGTLLTTLATYSNLNKGTAGVYSQKSLNVSAYKGQTVRIQFRATTDSSLATTFRVDSASLK